MKAFLILLSFFFACPAFALTCEGLFAPSPHKEVFSKMRESDLNYVRFSQSNKGEVEIQQFKFLDEKANPVRNENFKDSYILKLLKHSGHKSLHFMRDEKKGLKAIVAIHNTVLGKGTALGGTRMWDYSSEAEGLKDVLRLSEGMTYKSAMADVNFGGGKAVIFADSKTDKTGELLEEYGFYLNFLNTNNSGDRPLFVTGEDVGITPQDAKVVSKTGNGYIMGLPGRSGDPSIVTAKGVLVGIAASAKQAFNMPAPLRANSMEGLKVFVQGVGAVGKHVVEDLVKLGADVSIYDIDTNKIRALAEKSNGRVTVAESDQFLKEDYDIFVPCALGAIVNGKNIGRLRCKIIAGSANNQLESSELGDILRERNILYAPDYIINSGGLINVTTEAIPWLAELDKSAKEKWVSEKLSGIYYTLSHIYKVSKKAGVSTAETADYLAKEKIRKAVESR